MSDAGAGLPFHCPVLRASFFKSPCAGQVAAAKDPRAKFPLAVMPYGLEQCLKCGGERLVARERPAVVVATVKESLTVQEEEPMNDPVGIAQESSATEAPPCPKHPGNPQIACSPDGKRAGQYLGACKVCMQERKSGRKLKEKMTPAVARDLATVMVRGQVSGARNQAAAVAAVTPEIEDEHTMAVAVKFKTIKETERVLGPGKLPPNSKESLTPDQACKHHPDRLAHIDRLGRNMRLCPECLAARGRKVAVTNREQGINNAPFHIPLHAGKWADLKAWLAREAEENERTLAQEVMYRLKMAMRAAG